MKFLGTVMFRTYTEDMRILEDVSRRQGGEIGARTANDETRYLLEFLTTLKEEDSCYLEACPRQQEAQRVKPKFEVDVYSLQCAHAPAGGSLSVKGLCCAAGN